ncbi:MAG TPA: DUF5118 domain-containing protein, partial [Gemmatimonadaceae bacterium]|nr:DUF5118 domain-containing protein [Gemmatimonadaceae bacterium]
MSRTRLPFASILLSLAAFAVHAGAQNPPQQQPPAQSEGQQPGPAARRAPRPYAQVITARAHTEKGGITVHKVDERFYFEVPDSLMGRDFLMVTHVSGVPAGTGGFQSAGSALDERLVRWERANDRVLLRIISPDAVADDTLPIARSVAANNYSAIIGAFPIAAFARDSNAYVVDVTDFF